MTGEDGVVGLEMVSVEVAVVDMSFLSGFAGDLFPLSFRGRS
jgi:hypothetical protein